jgi:hypothetical protein
MKINKRKNHKKIFILGIPVLVLCALIAGWYFFYYTPTESSFRDGNIVNQATPAPNKLSDKDAQAKKEFIEGDNETRAEPSESKVDIFAVNDSDNVIVSSKLYGFSDGECSMSVTNGSKSFNESAQIIYQPEYSTCAGFSIPKSELGSGTWTIIVVAKHSNLTKEGATTIAVQ